MIQKARQLSRRPTDGFDFFIHNVFAASFDTGTFVSGQFIHDVAKHIQGHRWTIDVTGRDHFKSTRLYADIMWNIFTDDGLGFEAHYFSYSQELAAYHLKKVKKMIKENPFFQPLHDNKPTSESILDYQWRDENGNTIGRQMTVNPQGLLAFKRGIHAEYIYVDDPFRSEDSEITLDSNQIQKVNGIVIGELYPMVKKGGYFRVVGTPQTPNDFFFSEQLKTDFDIWITPAIVDEVKKQALWPEWKSFETLASLRKSMSEQKFNREYMAMPATAANSYIDRDRLLECCVIEKGYDFRDHQMELEHAIVLGGHDIGRMVHPAHLAVWVKRIEKDEYGETETYYEQIINKWMDNWDYVRQVNYLNDVCRYFNLHVLWYDNTRGEFMGQKDQGKLHRCLQPFVMNHQNQDKIAANFLTLVEQGRLDMINDPRQISQILAVHKNKSDKLVAIAGPDGHGDSFWSNAMALYEEKSNTPRIRGLY